MWLSSNLALIPLLLDKMAANCQMHLLEFRFKFHWNWQCTSIGSGNGLAPNRRQAITWTNDDPVHWRIYASLGEDELTGDIPFLSLTNDSVRHYSDVIIGAMASQITSPTIVYSTVYSGADQRKHQSSASLAFVRGIHRWPVNSPHKGAVTRKMFPFVDVIMTSLSLRGSCKEASNGIKTFMRIEPHVWEATGCPQCSPRVSILSLCAWLNM